jgi:single-strand DNA-binding protein
MTTPITLVGGLVAEPELAFTPSGVARANLRIATSKRTRNDDGTWTDGPSTYWRVTAWRKLAEHLADSGLAKGDELVIVGEAAEREYTTANGETRRTLEINATSIGLSLTRSPARISRTPRTDRLPGLTTTAHDDPWGETP